jgi:hypothetical protein
MRLNMKKENRKHVSDKEYFFTMNRIVRNQLTDEELIEFEKDIKTWELFRISKLVGMGHSDIDGIPTPLLVKKMRDFQNVDWNGGDDNEKYISCFTVKQFTKEEDEMKLHKSQGTTYKNIGEKYRTLQYQLMMYQIHFEMELGRNK